MMRHYSILILLLSTAVFLGCVRSHSEYGLILRNQTSGTLTDVQATLGDYTTIKLRLIPGAEVSFGDVVSTMPKEAGAAWTTADGRSYHSVKPVDASSGDLPDGNFIITIESDRMRLAYETNEERYKRTRGRMR